MVKQRALEDNFPYVGVIETDSDFSRSNPGCSTTLNDGVEISQQQPMTTAAALKQRAFVKITEQPASSLHRFRYVCESRSAGSISGVSTTRSKSGNKTFPTIQIVGYQGRAFVVVSCVTEDAPHRPHPHNLVGKDGCKDGVCTLEVSPETMSVTFSSLGIQCVRRRDVVASLKAREEKRVDPFRTGFVHRKQPTSIDLNTVRLCFQVFLEGDQKGKFTVPLTPVVSEPIYDKKTIGALVIVKLSDCVSPVSGGTKDIILLCDKVVKDNIKIRLYEEKDGRIEWEGFGDFQPSQVHKQTAIWFKAPRYKTLEVTEPVQAYIQLLRPSDGATSEPLPFQFLPINSGETLRHKVPKLQKLHLNNTIPSLYGGMNPMYTSSMAVSPQDGQYQISMDPLASISPPSNFQRKNSISNPNVGMNMLPSITEVFPQTWKMENNVQVQNGLTAACGTSAMTVDLSNNISNLLIKPPDLELMYNPNVAMNVLPLITELLPQSWEVPGVNNNNVIDVQNDLGGACGTSAMTVDSPNNISNLLDLDSQELKQINLNSDELPTCDANNLSQMLCNSLSFSDIDLQEQENQNMTDSLTRLADKTIGSIYQLNNMYRPSEEIK